MRMHVDVIVAGLAALAPDHYAGWTGERLAELLRADGVLVGGDGMVAHEDLLAAMDQRMVQRARAALSD